MTIALGGLLASGLDVVTENNRKTTEQKDLVVLNGNKDKCNDDICNNIKNIPDLGERIICLSSRIDKLNYELFQMNDSFSAKWDEHSKKINRIDFLIILIMFLLVLHAICIQLNGRR